MKKYKDWELLESLPKGWKIDKTVGSPLFGYQFCTNGKSVFTGQKRALVRVISDSGACRKISPMPEQSSCSNCVFFESFRDAYYDDMEPDDEGFCRNGSSPRYGNEGANSGYVCDFHNKRI